MTGKKFDEIVKHAKQKLHDEKWWQYEKENIDDIIKVNYELDCDKLTIQEAKIKLVTEK